MLAVRGPGDTDKLVKQMTSAKISSREHVRQIKPFAVMKGITGPARRRAPSGDRNDPKSTYFVIETGNELWRDKVYNTRSLCVFVPQAEPEFELTLFVVLPEDRRP